MGIELDLGGVGRHDELFQGPWTVNLVPPADIICDITDVDSYCADSSVSVFTLTHTLEHVPSQYYVKFLKDMYRKLAPGGRVEVIHTDAGRLLNIAREVGLPLRVVRMPLFSPADRLRENPYHQHFNMWSEEMLREDFEAVGYRTENFDAGYWSFDQVDELFPDETRPYHGVQIPNLGVRAWKDA